MGGVIGQWVTSGGIFVVLVLMVINSCGIPFPSEVIMPVAGVLAATGHFNIVAVIVAGIVGNLIGALVAYSLARRFGRPLLLGPGRRVGTGRAAGSGSPRATSTWRTAGLPVSACRRSSLDGCCR